MHVRSRALDSNLHRLWPSFHNRMRVAAIQGDHAVIMAEREKRLRITNGIPVDEDVKEANTEEDDDSDFDEPVVRVPGKAI
jgi:hypothetical protein